MNQFISFLQSPAIPDRAICETAERFYRLIFIESSAVDINRKQIAAEKGITQQGIVRNDNLANIDSNPFGETDSTIQGLIAGSYASRFGQHAGQVSPAANSRTSNGMAGGCGPQNVSASCDTPAG